MNQNKVLSVFNSYDMQKFFLIMTKRAEEYAYTQLPDETRNRIDMNQFLEKVKKTPALKKVIQDMILLSVSEIDWDYSFSLLENYYVENSKITMFESI